MTDLPGTKGDLETIMALLTPEQKRDHQLCSETCYPVRPDNKKRSGPCRSELGAVSSGIALGGVQGPSWTSLGKGSGRMCGAWKVH